MRTGLREWCSCVCKALCCVERPNHWHYSAVILHTSSVLTNCCYAGESGNFLWSISGGPWLSLSVAANAFNKKENSGSQQWKTVVAKLDSAIARRVCLPNSWLNTVWPQVRLHSDSGVMTQVAIKCFWKQFILRQSLVYLSDISIFPCSH